MRHTHARWIIIGAALFLLEVNNMSNHAVGFESSEIGATLEGWTSTLTGSEIQNGRSKAMKLHRQNRRCSSNPAARPIRCS
jgi:hypothetical protein